MIVLADKAYDADRIRALIEEQGARPNIPAKSNRKWKPCFSKRLYRERNLKRFREPACGARLKTTLHCVNIQRPLRYGIRRDIRHAENAESRKIPRLPGGFD